MSNSRNQGLAAGPRVGRGRAAPSGGPRASPRTRDDHDVERLAEIFGALSSPHRLRILLRLITCCAPGTVCSIEPGTRPYVGDLGKALGIAPSTVSHHIKELRRAGLIRMERAGQRIECWVDPEALEEVSRFFSR